MNNIIWMYGYDAEKLAKKIEKIQEITDISIKNKNLLTDSIKNKKNLYYKVMTLDDSICIEFYEEDFIENDGIKIGDFGEYWFKQIKIVINYEDVSFDFIYEEDSVEDIIKIVEIVCFEDIFDTDLGVENITLNNNIIDTFGKYQKLIRKLTKAKNKLKIFVTNVFELDSEKEYFVYKIKHKIYKY